MTKNKVSIADTCIQKIIARDKMHLTVFSRLPDYIIVFDVPVEISNVYRNEFEWLLKKTL